MAKKFPEGTPVTPLREISDNAFTWPAEDIDGKGNPIPTGYENLEGTSHNAIPYDPGL